MNKGDKGDEIVFGAPQIGERERELVEQVLRSGWIGQGKLVAEFEQRLCDYTGAGATVAVSSCTAALQLALVAAGVGDGDEVVTTPFTFTATLNAIEAAGAEPVLVDIDRDSLNISPAAVEPAIGPKTRAVMPVHFGGRPLDVPGFAELADRHDLWVIEDAAHAIGAVSAGRRIGGSGHPRIQSCFSFYPNKNLASAEGGAVALADEEVASRLHRLRQHGLEQDAWDRFGDPHYQPSFAVDTGFKANWTDLQAAIALPQLERLEGFLATRERLAARYDRLLAEVDGVEPVDRGPSDGAERHALHLYQMIVEGSERDEMVGRLRAAGVGAGVHYVAAHRHPQFERLGHDRLQNSEWASEALITLPLHPGLSEADAARVVDAVRQARSRHSGRKRPATSSSRSSGVER